MKKIFNIIGIILFIIIAAVVVLFFIAAYKNEHYYNYLDTTEILEAKYAPLGEYEVKTISFDDTNSESIKHEVWYPSELENETKQYPMVIIANGTGIKASNNKSFYNHLASWGFIVVGNEDENSKTGKSTSESLDYMMNLNSDENSIFANKIDVKNIGVGGHSQGGVGAINALNNQANGNLYKAIFTVSCTSPYHAEELVEGWSYDVSKINIPYFMVAGTGLWDAGKADSIGSSEAQGICPLYVMSEHYNNIPSANKVMGRLKDIDHGETYKKADSYMTAWFRYWLMNDEEAKDVFFGENAEITANANWQDVQKSI